jgi:hypothetical protein
LDAALKGIAVLREENVRRRKELEEGKGYRQHNMRRSSQPEGHRTTEWSLSLEGVDSSLEFDFDEAGPGAALVSFESDISGSVEVKVDEMTNALKPTRSSLGELGMTSKTVTGLFLLAKASQ